MKPKWIIEFCELGSYDSINGTFKTEQEANNELDRLIKEYGYKGYFGFVARQTRVVRVPELSEVEKSWVNNR